MEFKKSQRLENIKYAIRGPVFEKAHAMQNAGIDIINLNIGNPAPFGFNVPDEMVQDIIANIKRAQGYVHHLGIFSARKAVMQYCQQIGINNVEIEDVYIGNGVRQRFGRIHPGAKALKTAPAATSDEANLFGNIARQRPFAERIEHGSRVTGILQDFGDVGQWLVQRAAARRGWLDAGPRPASPRNQAFRLERAQRLAHREARHAIAFAQIAFCRKTLGFIRPAQDFFAQLVGQFLVTWLGGQILSPRSAAGAA